MEIPKEIVLGIKTRQGAVEALGEQVSRAAGESLEVDRLLEEAMAPEKFPEKFLVPFRITIKKTTGLWVEALGGSESRFDELRRRQVESQNEFDKYRMRELEAEQALWDFIDRYLRTTDSIYKKRSEALEAIRKINEIAEKFYREATDIRCALIGFKSPQEFERIRVDGMVKMRELLPRAIEGLQPWEKFLFDRGDDELLEPFSGGFKRLLLRLSACTLKSETMERTEHELDVILEVMRNMTNGTRYPNWLDREWLSPKVDRVKRLALEAD